MKFKAKIFITSLIVCFSFSTISAQSIDYNNQVEYSENEFEDDLNSIKVVKKSETRIVKKQVVTEEAALIDLAAALENKRLYYRNVRKPSEKCYRESEESCSTPKQ